MHALKICISIFEIDLRHPLLEREGEAKLSPPGPSATFVVGHEMMEIIDDKPIQEVTHSDGRSYVDILGQLPVNKEKDPKYRDKTISEILKMKGVKPQNPQNVNKKLGRINTFWKWVGEKYPDYVKEQVFKGNDLPP